MYIMIIQIQRRKQKVITYYEQEGNLKSFTRGS